jgi:hypothetical protein
MEVTRWLQIDRAAGRPEVGYPLRRLAPMSGLRAGMGGAPVASRWIGGDDHDSHRSNFSEGIPVTVRPYDLSDAHEKAIYEALLPISVSLVAKEGFKSDEARRQLEVSLAVYGMLIAIATKAKNDDERYGWVGCNVRDDIELEDAYREEHEIEAHEDAGDSGRLRDSLETEMEAAIAAIQGAPKHYKRPSGKWVA